MITIYLRQLLKKEILTKWLPALDQPINPKYGIHLRYSRLRMRTTYYLIKLDLHAMST